MIKMKQRIHRLSIVREISVAFRRLSVIAPRSECTDRGAIRDDKFTASPRKTTLNSRSFLSPRTLVSARRLALAPVLVAVGVFLCSVLPCVPLSAQVGLMPNGHLESVGDKAPNGFTLLGDVSYGDLGDSRVELSGRGFRLHGATDTSGDARHQGVVIATVSGINSDHEINSTNARWYRLDVCGMAQDNFKVTSDGLYLKVEFFKDDGRNSLDMIKQPIYAQVERERADLKDEGTNKNLGLAVWRNY